MTTQRIHRPDLAGADQTTEKLSDVESGTQELKNKISVPDFLSSKLRLLRKDVTGEVVRSQNSGVRMEDPAKTFEDLIVWQKARQFVLAVCRTSRKAHSKNRATTRFFLCVLCDLCGEYSGGFTAKNAKSLLSLLR